MQTYGKGGLESANYYRRPLLIIMDGTLHDLKLTILDAFIQNSHFRLVGPASIIPPEILILAILDTCKMNSEICSFGKIQVI